MANSVRYPLAGIVFLVLLRMSIGWQFLYEGLWKIHSQSSATPWTSEGYLKNAAGPFRSTFRNMTDDPNDFAWLDADQVAAKWDTWADLFARHYGLDEKQQARLTELLEGPKEFKVALAKLPAGVEIPKALAKTVKFDAKGQRLICDGKTRMIPTERELLVKDAKGDDDVSKAYRKAVLDLFAAATKKLAYKEKLRASLVGDPSRAGVIQDQFKGTVDYKRLGDIELYREQVKRYDQNLAAAKQDFQFKHLERQWSELQALRSKVTGPIKALEKDLKDDARKLLTSEQLALGPVALPKTKIDRINQQTIAGLTILGVCLIAGLLTRPAAVMGAVMMVMFYLPMPPWPGVPEAPGPEHSFIINKNLIEAIALLAIACLPTGQWFGVDSLWTRFLCRNKCCGGACSTTTAATAPTTSAPATTPAT